MQTVTFTRFRDAPKVYEAAADGTVVEAGIDSGRRMLAEVAMLDARALAIGGSPVSRSAALLDRLIPDAVRGSVAPSASDRAAVLDCLRVRDLGGDWLGHPSFEAGAHSDVVDDALVRDGLAVWDDLGIHITPRGRRAWADQRIALRDLADAIGVRL